MGPQEHDRSNVFNTMEKHIGNNTTTTQLLPEKLSSANGRLPADFIDGNIAEIEQADRKRKRKTKNYQEVKNATHATQSTPNSVEIVE